MAQATVIAAGEFHRLDVCAGEKCDDVYIDTSRSRSRRFCSPATCGNRASVAAYRARQRGQRHSQRGR
ncbi:MAG: CGNR zinc finger domain-containing protein [Actinobacteria bacterium]|nr:CGNR zinc finger domain-containing protein [Actinomycetota bacterium]